MRLMKLQSALCAPAAMVFALAGFLPLSARAEAVLEAKNLHATTVEVPASTAAFFNAAGERAKGVLPGEHSHFDETDRRYVMLAVPAAPMPEAAFLAEFERLEVRVDGSWRIRLADYPRLFSRNLDDPDIIRGVPTIVPEHIFPADFIGSAHDFELLRDGSRIFGPVRWLVPDERSGPIVTAVRGGPGKGEVTFELEKIDFRLMALVVYLDSRFGDPLSVEQVLPDGQVRPLSVKLVGEDTVGDQRIFREAYLEGFTAGFARNLEVRIRFDHSGEGYFGAVGQAYTRYQGNRIIDVP